MRTVLFLKKEVTKTSFARTICVCKCNRFKSFMWAVILGQARIYISDPLAVFAVIERLAVRDPTALKLYSCRNMCDFHTTQFSWLSSLRLNCQDRSFFDTSHLKPRFEMRSVAGKGQSHQFSPWRHGWKPDSCQTHKFVCECETWVKPSEQKGDQVKWSEIDAVEPSEPKLNQVEPNENQYNHVSPSEPM